MAKQSVVEISLTDFLDFVCKAGTPKVTCVRNVKYRKAYHPAQDFYKPVRDALVEFHQDGKPKKYLDSILTQVKDTKKLPAYQQIVMGHKKFLGRKSVSWVEPAKDIWVSDQLAVSINPELGLHFGERDHLIKVYFKETPITKRQTEVILHLMKTTLVPEGSDVTCAILDVRKGKLIDTSPDDPSLGALLRGEAYSFVQIYQSV